MKPESPEALTARPTTTGLTFDYTVAHDAGATIGSETQKKQRSSEVSKLRGEDLENLLSFWGRPQGPSKNSQPPRGLIWASVGTPAAAAALDLVSVKARSRGLRPLRARSPKAIPKPQSAGNSAGLRICSNSLSLSCAILCHPVPSSRPG